MQSNNRCPMCNRLATKLVPLYDNDQNHVNTQCCQDCKRKIKKGQTIIKYDEVEANGKNL